MPRAVDAVPLEDIVAANHILANEGVAVSVEKKAFEDIGNRMKDHMFWRPALVCLLAVASAVSASGAQSQRVRSDQEILMQLERDWDAAFHRRDAVFIEQILADEFMATYPDGSRGNKAKELALAATVSQQIESSTLDEFTVKVYGDTAVVWFTQHLTGRSQGQPLAVTSRYVDVFVMRAGRWQCVASQSTRVA